MLSDDPILSEFTPEGHADPEGDVIFYLDTESTSTDGQHHLLKISSQTMSRASPAFRAMFNPRFTGRADFSPHDPLEISLPEDDYQAMTWICFALHLQNLPEGRMPLALLKKIALLADKYDLARKLQPWSRLWLDEWSDSAAQDKDRWELLWMAYALFDVQMFYQASQKLIYGKTIEGPDFDSDSLDGVGFSLLPARIIASIRTQRSLAIDSMHKLLRWVKPMCIYESKRHDDEFINELTRLGLMPIKSVLEERGITHYIDRLHDIRMQPCVMHRDTKSDGTNVLICQSGRPVMDYVYKAKDAMLGLCLLCLKQGKETASLDSFSAENSYHMNLSIMRGVGISGGPSSGPSPKSEWSYEHNWRTHKIVRTDREERILSKAIKHNNCMAATPWEHRQHHKYVQLCSKTRDRELSEKRGWAEFFESSERRLQENGMDSAIA
ncbi:L-amino-acid oxidase [Physcia stellaris]|nr:L-amino-acid oxidase [Physcia stellaris]